MALLGFKRRFVPMILDGSKRHTIRGKRDRPIKVGEALHCYVDPRRKSMTLLGRWRCVRVQAVEIRGYFPRVGDFIGGVFIDGEQILQDECEALARSDGFQSFADMMKFWDGRLPFHGDLIHWDYTDTCSAPKSKKPATKTRRQKKGEFVGSENQIDRSRR